MSIHLLRLRDTLYSSLPSSSPTASYDPASISIGTGTTIYSTVRGDQPELAAAVEAESKLPRARSPVDATATPS